MTDATLERKSRLGLGRLLALLVLLIVTAALIVGSAIVWRPPRVVRNDHKPFSWGSGAGIILLGAPGEYHRVGTLRTRGASVENQLGAIVTTSEPTKVKLCNEDSACEKTLEENAAINAIAGSGRLLLTGSVDGCLRLWDVASGCELRTFKGHRGPVNDVAFVRSATLAISASDDRTLKLWDVERGVELRTYEGHADRVLTVAVGPEASGTILSGGSDGSLKLWSLEAVTAIATLAEHGAPIRALAFSLDGTRALSGDDAGAVRLWNLRNGRLDTVFDGHAGPVGTVDFADEERDFALSECATEGGARLWDLRGGREIPHEEALKVWMEGLPALR